MCVILSTTGEETQFLSKFFTESDFVFKSDRFRHIDDRKKRKGAGFVKKFFYLTNL